MDEVDGSDATGISMSYFDVPKNFAIHLPVIDRVFGTLYLPRQGWPAAYGIAGSAVPDRYPAQLVFPFTGRPVTGVR